MICAAPLPLLAQTVTIGGAANVVAADDFATRAFQDPWDMNERTDLGWFLNGLDDPQSNLTNVSFSGGVFSATTASVNQAQVFLLESAIIGSARIGKIGTNYPIDANTYRVMAFQMYVSAPAVARLTWFRESIYDTATGTNSGFINLTPGWRTYLVSIPALGLVSGTTAWSGTIKSLQFYITPSAGVPVTWQIDWVRLVTENPNFCRQVSWSGFAGPVDLYLDLDSASGNEWLFASGVGNNTASGGCSQTGSGYNFSAGALAPGTYYVVARPAGATSGGARSSSAFNVNATPTLRMTSPSEEGSNDDFATASLGNPWDMNALSDVDAFFNVSGQTITTIPAETQAGASLGNVQVLWAQNSQPTPSDPVVGLLFGRNARIDPVRYRVLTVEFGLHNTPRWVGHGSVARIGWRVVGQPDSVSDDIIVDSRAGANVMQKIIVDMADRNVLAIEQGSTIGWVPGSSSTPGIDRFRVDVHEFPNATPFFIRRVKLTSFERVPPGTNYTIRWTASEAGTVTLYYDTDKNPATGLTLIGSAAAAAGSFVWIAPNVGGSPAYFIYAVVDDGQGNSNSVYSRWPVIVGTGFATGLTAPTGFRIVPY
jgi:hypothetical protein